MSLSCVKWFLHTEALGGNSALNKIRCGGSRLKRERQEVQGFRHPWLHSLRPKYLRLYLKEEKKKKKVGRVCHFFCPCDSRSGLEEVTCHYTL